MSDQVVNIAKTLKTIDSDLNAVGWDLDSRIYHLIDDADDPIARLAGVMPSYPPTDIQAAYDHGMRCPENLLGLVVANEGYRHLSFDELAERAPDLIERVRREVDAAGFAEAMGIDESEVQDAMKSYYYNSLMHRLPPPHVLPPHLRVELRIVSAVLKDGTGIIHTHSRDCDDSNVDIFSANEMIEQAIPRSLYMFMHDVRPDLECEDPLTVVKDANTLKVLASLPTADN